MKIKQAYMATSMFLFLIALGLLMKALSGVSDEIQNSISTEDFILRLVIIVTGSVAGVFWKLAVKKN